ncbi:divergent polysaccharide deacetylase family protein [bacterium]|nr:divergent polysaccharide deacetylase family protein [bacterium]
MSPARTSRKSRKKQGTRPVVWFAGIGLAAVLVIAGIGLLKWAETEPGQAALLTLGSDKMYAEVQTTVEQTLKLVLPALAVGPGPVLQDGGLAPGSDGDWAAPQLGPGAAIRCRTVAVQGGAPYWVIQRNLAAALEAIGARILWCERIYPARPGPEQLATNDELDLIRLDVGVPGRPTHTLVLHREDRSPAIRWGADQGRTAWQVFAAESAPTLALVIDDWGNNKSDAARAILDLDSPLTLAVLPGRPFSREFALNRTDLVLPPEQESDRGDLPADGQFDPVRGRLAAGCPVEVALGRKAQPIPGRRREVLLHLPMEPEGYPDPDPGAGALMVGMDQEAIAALIDGHRKALPMVTGVNNHMGSAATADEATMQALMTVLRERDLFFLDSLTTSKSVAAAAAAREGIPVLSNRLFLDYDSEDAGRIRANLDRLVEAARATGFAVGIGHPYPATAEVLRRELPRLEAAGVRLVTVSELLALKQEADKVRPR